MSGTRSQAVSPPLARALVGVLALGLLLALALRLAWLGDDAFITLRSVENWTRGNGLCWNAVDRVQTYTHPLWMLCLSLARWLSGEVYFTTLAVSLVLSMTAVAWLLLRCGSVQAMWLSASLLLGSAAFADYMTSGLETPLTYVGLVAMVSLVLCRPTDERAAVRRYTAAVLVASLLACNRMDLALLCLPPVLATMARVPPSVVVLRGALASLPFVVWLAFATVYYGSPFPVTAHAKAFGVGIPASDLAVQGLRYLAHIVRHGPPEGRPKPSPPFSPGFRSVRCPVRSECHENRHRWHRQRCPSGCRYRNHPAHQHRSRCQRYPVPVRQPEHRPA